jgi:putative membrane protein
LNLGKDFMHYLTEVLVALVAILHFLFLILEMFLWQTPYGRRTFGMTADAAAQTAVWAKNQGFYNGILAAGLVWSFFIPDPHFQAALRTYLLISIVAAGIYGALTAKSSILYIQALPAFLALIAVYFYNIL